MTNKEIKIAYIEYESLDQLDADDRKTADAAVEAISLSYAPYSRFNVGAAVMFEDGEIVKGANQENAAYPSGLCAERTALFYARSLPLPQDRRVSSATPQPLHAEPAVRSWRSTRQRAGGRWRSFWWEPKKFGSLRRLMTCFR